MKPPVLLATAPGAATPKAGAPGALGLPGAPGAVGPTVMPPMAPLGSLPGSLLPMAPLGLPMVPPMSLGMAQWLGWEDY